MNELALFAGGGGGILGGLILGWKTVCAVEINKYCRRVLMQRQDDGCLEPFPIWHDIRTFDGRPWAGCVDIVTGGFPCQDISAAGKGAGIDGERSGLWSEMARVIGEIRPCYVYVENSPLLVSRGLARVLGDLAAMGFDARWGIVGAHHVGAPHKRDRIWILANTTGHGREQLRAESARREGILEAVECGECSGEDVADSDRERQLQQGGAEREKRGWSGYGGSSISEYGIIPMSDAFRDRLEGKRETGTETRTTDGPEHGRNFCWWESEPELGRVAHGVAARMEFPFADVEGGMGRVATGIRDRGNRLRAIGNGQVPAVVAEAFRVLF